jgi:hypothetical protein
MSIGVNELARAHQHPEDVHLAAKSDRMHEGVRRRHLPAQHAEPRRDRVEIARAAVRHYPGAAERSVNGAIDLTPEAAEPLVAIHVVNDDDLRRPALRNIPIVFEPPLPQRSRVEPLRPHSRYSGRLCVPHQRRPLRKRADQRLRREANRAAARRHELDRVADRRRIKGSERGELHGIQQVVSVGQVGHLTLS